MAATSAEVTTVEALKRGLRGLCPACSDGRIFRAYLKVDDRCPECGEELHHHRADDFPAFIVILIVGHIVVPLILLVETHFAPPYWLHMVVWPAMVVVLVLLLLQPVKGAIVALQWAMGMHGFDEAKQQRLLAKTTVAAAADT